MGTNIITLDPILDRRRSPYYLFHRLGEPPTTDYQFNAGWNLEVPNVWELVYFRSILYADATVANRKIIISQTFKRGTDLIAGQYIQTDNITANQSKMAEYSRLIASSAFTPNSDKYCYVSAKNLIIEGDDFLTFYWNLGQAGDNSYTTIILKYLNWELGMALPDLYQEKPRNRVDSAQRQSSEKFNFWDPPII